jgi:DNA-binding MarR family transcriptional regulator
VGAMLRVVWQWVREQLFAGVIEAGYTDLNPAHVALFRYPSVDGYRPTQLADELQITKQSVNDLLGHLEAHGYLVREPDPTDGRARTVRLTAKGRRLERTINAEARNAELRIAAMLGPETFSRFRHTLETLANELDGINP